MNFHRFDGIKRRIHLHGHYLRRNYGEKLSEIASSYTLSDAPRWNEVWRKEKYFIPKEDGAKPNFTMILPPPNVTGTLHLGHALTATVQDVLVRWHRMKGESVMWVPGLDHAGIATQAVVEKYLARKKGATRHDFSKDDFLSLINDWKDKNGKEIREQLKSLGASLDWSREFFTMSKEHNKAVTEAFALLYQRGLFYRKKALINWSSALQSAISEMEIEHIVINGKTKLAVPGYERKVEFGVIARVKLNLRDCETMPGDVAIAVNPEDSRYSRYIGREVWHPIRKTFIPIIQDSSVKMDFGTGAVKITPAHDHHDLAMATRHNLEIIEVIGNDGKMNDSAGSLKGLARFTARERIYKELTELGALESLENHNMMIPVCSRSGDIVEYLLREQWFMKTKEMAERAVQAVMDGSLRIDPPEWSKLWCDWLGNNRDWCISRQICWGHRIPAYRCEGSDWIIARTEQEARMQFEKAAGNTEPIIEQDEDVLDTWFSSAILPLSAMGWPDNKFEKFYPLSLMETGHDIIFLWVARMVMLGLELTDTLPFKRVLFHGVLCDASGKKMSKSRGNVIKPEYVINGMSLEDLNAEARKSFENGVLSQEELKRNLSVNAKVFPDGIPECGVDALRLTLCAHNIKSSRISFSVIECRTNKHFCNKIWQATRYVLGIAENCEKGVDKPETLCLADRWIISRMTHMVEEVNKSFDDKNFYKAVRAIKQFFYYEFCDFYLEITKNAFKNHQRDLIDGHTYTLAKCLEVSLRILAPITPYLAEHLYSQCAGKMPSVFLPLASIVEVGYPTVSGDLAASRDTVLEDKFDNLLEAVCALRTVLTQVKKKSGCQIHIVTDDEDRINFFAENLNVISAVTRLQNIQILPAKSYERRKNSLLCSSAGSGCPIFLLFDDETDVLLVQDKIERTRLKSVKQLENLLKATSQPKFDNKSEEEKLRKRDKIKELEEELRQYPKIAQPP